MEEKLELHRENWQGVFQINPEENANYDLEHERNINNYLLEHNNELEVYAEADLF